MAASTIDSRLEQAKITTMNPEEIQSFITRVEDALETGMALSDDDLRLALVALKTVLSMKTTLEDHAITLSKLRKLLGIEVSSERRPPADDANDVEAMSKREREEYDQLKEQQRKRDKRLKELRGRKKSASASERKPTVEHHRLEDCAKGDRCPGCNMGNLGKREPLQFLRVTGHASFSSVNHVRERLACGSCGLVITAPLPEAITRDGGEGQRYGYTARAVIAIQKCAMGTPYFRNEKVSTILGVKIASSTQFDQCQYVADAIEPVYQALVQSAGNGHTLYADDTTNKILGNQPEKRKRRSDNAEVTRSGNYTTVVISYGDNRPPIVTFKTNLGHTGECLDETLRERQADLDKPTVMTDASSSTTVTVIDTIRALCNAHARRKFVEVEKYSDIAEQAIKLYKTIWHNDDESVLALHKPEQRLEYHKTHSLPVMERIKRLCDEALSDPHLEEHSQVAKAFRYFVTHYEGLTAFCRTKGAPIDNNESEETLKLAINVRKNSYFFKTQNGATVVDRLLTIIATCERTGTNAYDYLVDLQRNADQLRESPEAFLPWNYTPPPADPESSEHDKRHSTSDQLAQAG